LSIKIIKYFQDVNILPTLIQDSITRHYELGGVYEDPSLLRYDTMLTDK